MARIRTTVSLQHEVYEEARSTYQGLGFSRLGDLIGVAVSDYLRQKRLEARDRVMSQAAGDTRYRKVVLDMSRELETLDADGLDTSY